MNITEKERNILTRICLSDYNDGATVCGHMVWDFSVHLDKDTASFPGIVSSLLKKKLVTVEDYDDTDKTIAITQTGLDAIGGFPA
jgi:hypothetical protein